MLAGLPGQTFQTETVKQEGRQDMADLTAQVPHTPTTGSFRPPNEGNELTVASSLITIGKQCHRVEAQNNLQIHVTQQKEGRAHFKVKEPLEHRTGP